jgi:hypothetical protein
MPPLAESRRAATKTGHTRLSRFARRHAPQWLCGDPRLAATHFESIHGYRRLLSKAAGARQHMVRKMAAATYRNETPA